MTLLRYIPIKSLLRNDVPQYLTFAMASLGSVASSGRRSDAKTLWWAANLLIAATLEVDNLEARKVDLVNAVCSSDLLGICTLTYNLLSGLC
jgi:hypothetical protein